MKNTIKQSVDYYFKYLGKLDKTDLNFFFLSIQHIF